MSKITGKKGARVVGPAREAAKTAAVKMYEKEGLSIRIVAEELGRSYGFTHRLLEEAGVTFRGRGGATRKAEPKA